MSRLQDAIISLPQPHFPDLPVVDWRRLNQQAPAPIPFNYAGPQAPLPRADVVLITWTSHEWSALDHVFRHSNTPRSKDDNSWRQEWVLYGRSAPASDSADNPLWGLYQLVSVPALDGGAKTVLLFKANTHLAYPPYITGLSQMLQAIFADAQPAQVYSLGTAGGSRPHQDLGDTIVTNSGHLSLKLPENLTAVDYNDQTISGNWFPPTGLLKNTARHLLYPLSNVVTYDMLDTLVAQLYVKEPAAAPFKLADLINDEIRPEMLHTPDIETLPGVPLLSTDYYFIAPSPTAVEQYSCLEMDDAVIAHEAQKAGVDFAFVRNISDPVVRSRAEDRTALPDAVRDAWSSQIYEAFGLYTSYNGALAAWATLASAMT